MSGYRSLNNSTIKRVLNLLEPVKLTVWKVMIERVTAVKFRVKYGGDKKNKMVLAVLKSISEYSEVHGCDSSKS